MTRKSRIRLVVAAALLLAVAMPACRSARGHDALTVAGLTFTHHPNRTSYYDRGGLRVYYPSETGSGTKDGQTQAFIVGEEILILMTNVPSGVFHSTKGRKVDGRATFLTPRNLLETVGPEIKVEDVLNGSLRRLLGFPADGEAQDVTVPR